MLDGLSMATAAGCLVGGAERLQQALRNGEVSVVAVAADASPRTLEGFRRVAGEEVVFVNLRIDREALGARMGRGFRAAVGVRHGRASRYLISQLHRLLALG